MPLVHACITPHGTDIIPLLAKNLKTTEKFSTTREGMLSVARELKKADPNIIVIASPHNLRVWKKIAISFAENSSGMIRSESSSMRGISLSVKNDIKFARQLYGRALDRKLPVVGVNYGTFEGPASDLPMDWGTMVPLWFLLGDEVKREKKHESPRVVIVAPSREIPIRCNVLFGKEIAKLAEGIPETRVAFVASTDQSHTHRNDGPYGYHSSAEKFDRIVTEAVKNEDLSSLLDLDPAFIEDAKPDSVWQLAMLHGIMQEISMKGVLFSYESPTYFGMLCACFAPKGET